jgi:two-component system sensor histidine kinase BaeS
MRSLTARAVVVTCAASLISVLATALVAVPLAARSAEAEAHRTLLRESRLLAEVIGPRLATQRPLDEQRLLQRLRRQGFDVYLVRQGRADPAGLPEAVVAPVAAGSPVDVRRGDLWYSGRPAGAAGDGVVLVRAAPRVWRTALGRAGLWFALLAGLAAGLVSGVVLARRLARPIRAAAAAAGRLSAGDRSVRLAEEAPAEAAELARSFNGLAEALATSEDRQRDFLLSVSHELRTPLTTIRGYAEALADGVVGPEGAPRAGQTVLAEAERLDRLVADLLALARLEAADFRLEPLPVDLVALVAAAAEAWGGRCAEAGVVLRTELPDAPVVAHTDPGRIRQVVDGLCENALRVVPPGGALVLAVRAADRAVVEVRDGGPGLTDDDLAVAFQRGVLHRRYQGARVGGSGLGLALAARLVRRLGGDIDAGHAREGGARFTVALPYEARTRR